MFITDKIKNQIKILQIMKTNEISDIDLYIRFYKGCRNPYFSYLDNSILIEGPTKNEYNYYNLIIIILYFIKYFNNATREEKRI